MTIRSNTPSTSRLLFCKRAAVNEHTRKHYMCVFVIKPSQHDRNPLYTARNFGQYSKRALIKTTERARSIESAPPVVYILIPQTPAQSAHLTNYIYSNLYMGHTNHHKTANQLNDQLIKQYRFVININNY